MIFVCTVKLYFYLYLTLLKNKQEERKSLIINVNNKDFFTGVIVYETKINVSVGLKVNVIKGSYDSIEFSHKSMQYCTIICLRLFLLIPFHCYIFKTLYSIIFFKYQVFNFQYFL